MEKTFFILLACIINSHILINYELMMKVKERYLVLLSLIRSCNRVSLQGDIVEPKCSTDLKRSENPSSSHLFYCPAILGCLDFPMLEICHW